MRCLSYWPLWGYRFAGLLIGTIGALIHENPLNPHLRPSPLRPHRHTSPAPLQARRQRVQDRASGISNQREACRQ